MSTNALIIALMLGVLMIALIYEMTRIESVLQDLADLHEQQLDIQRQISDDHDKLIDNYAETDRRMAQAWQEIENEMQRMAEQQNTEDI